jgi:hypothetical protein
MKYIKWQIRSQIYNQIDNQIHNQSDYQIWTKVNDNIFHQVYQYNLQILDQIREKL